MNDIIQGDALSVLKMLPEKIVNCCVTSPPYWGLRDYGTGSWDGGDHDCDHIVNPRATKTCPKCGAIRIDNQIGLESDIDDYITKLCDIFDEVGRIMTDEGTLWVNLGDTYGGSGGAGGDYNPGGRREGQPRYRQPFDPLMKIKNTTRPKSLCLIPLRFALEMYNRGWIVRNRIVWWKRNCMPSSAKDRFTVDFEDVYFLTKNEHYYFETQYEPIAEESVRRSLRGRNLNKYSEGSERPPGVHANTMSQPKAYQGYNDLDQVMKSIPGRIKRSVWDIPTKGCKDAHFATYPEKLIETPILAGCPEGGVVLDPFMGSGTTAIVAEKLKRQWLGIELNPEYVTIATKRIEQARAQMEIF